MTVPGFPPTCRAEMMTFESTTTRSGMDGRGRSVTEFLHDGVHVLFGPDAKLLRLLRPVRERPLPRCLPCRAVVQVVAKRGAYELGERLVLALGATLNLFQERRREGDRDWFTIGHGHAPVRKYNTAPSLGHVAKPRQARRARLTAATAGSGGASSSKWRQNRPGSAPVRASG